MKLVLAVPQWQAGALDMVDRQGILRGVVIEVNLADGQIVAARSRRPSSGGAPGTGLAFRECRHDARLLRMLQVRILRRSEKRHVYRNHAHGIWKGSAKAGLCP